MSIKMIEAVLGQRPGGQRRWEPRGWSVSTENKLTSRGSAHMRVEAEIQGHPQLTSELEASLSYKKLWEKMLTICVSSVPTAYAHTLPHTLLYTVLNLRGVALFATMCPWMTDKGNETQRHPVASLRTHGYQKHTQRQAVPA